MLQSLIDIFKYESLWHKAEFAVFFVSAYALVTFVRFPLFDYQRPESVAFLPYYNAAQISTRFCDGSSRRNLVC